MAASPWIIGNLIVAVTCSAWRVTAEWLSSVVATLFITTVIIDHIITEKNRVYIDAAVLMNSAVAKPFKCQASNSIIFVLEHLSRGLRSIQSL